MFEKVSGIDNFMIARTDLGFGCNSMITHLPCSAYLDMMVLGKVSRIDDFIIAWTDLGLEGNSFAVFRVFTYIGF